MTEKPEMQIKVIDLKAANDQNAACAKRVNDQKTADAKIGRWLEPC